MNRLQCKPLYLLLGLLLGSMAQAVLPLRDQWGSACAALKEGDAARATALFREFREWYGEETEVADPAFREGWLRLWGLAALQSGAVEEALPLLETWLREFPEQPRYRAFVRFQTALACRSLGLRDETIHHWTAFLEQHGTLPEAALVRWMWADLLIGEARLEEGREQLMAVLEGASLPPSGRALARAALALVELSLGSEEAAFDHLALSTGKEAFPAHGLWKALLAPALTDRLMRMDRLAEALEAASWMDLPENLESGFSQLAAAISERRPSGVRSMVWNKHWDRQVRRLQATLETSNKEGPGGAGLYALRLRALLRAEEAESALVLARALLLSPSSLAVEARPAAYAGAIEACRMLGKWNHASRIASEFIRDFPEDPALPEILFQLARTHAARKDWSDAIGQADKLLDNWPGHRSRRSWQTAAASWRLQAGRPAEALEQFLALESDAPPSWTPYLRFQQGRCLTASGKPNEAARLFSGVANNPSAAAGLREFAWTELLKLAMRDSAADRFPSLLEDYRKGFPDGIHRLTVENLAGTWNLHAGRKGEAEQLFQSVAKHIAPEGLFAHEQLSRMYGSLPDPGSLRSHAIGWIRQALSAGLALPPRPFEDGRLYQERTGQPVFPAEMCRTLLERMEADDPSFPAETFLGLLASGWHAYREGLGLPGEPVLEWARGRAEACLRSNLPLACSRYRLFQAALLERQGRSDSADTVRIGVMRSADPSLLGESELFTVARTSDRYDFPGTVPLLESFLARFGQSGKRPEVLFRLAMRRRASGDAQAPGLLGEILAEWPDAGVFPQACLSLGEWRLADNQPARAGPVLERLLDRPGLPPETTARALLLRARADFATGNLERASLGCRRLLNLYPDFHDIINIARSLLDEHA
ncbi:MAG: hypothetical protein ACP5I4_12800 [Oceanipulchritudo sp.]